MQFPSEPKKSIISFLQQEHHVFMWWSDRSLNAGACASPTEFGIQGSVIFFALIAKVSQGIIFRKYSQAICVSSGREAEQAYGKTIQHYVQCNAGRYRTYSSHVTSFSHSEYVCCIRCSTIVHCAHLGSLWRSTVYCVVCSTDIDFRTEFGWKV